MTKNNRKGQKCRVIWSINEAEQKQSCLRGGEFVITAILRCFWSVENNRLKWESLFVWEHFSLCFSDLHSTWNLVHQKKYVKKSAHSFCPDLRMASIHEFTYLAITPCLLAPSPSIIAEIINIVFLKASNLHTHQLIFLASIRIGALYWSSKNCCWLGLDDIYRCV